MPEKFEPRLMDTLRKWFLGYIEIPQVHLIHPQDLERLKYEIYRTHSIVFRGHPSGVEGPYQNVHFMGVELIPDERAGRLA